MKSLIASMSVLAAATALLISAPANAQSLTGAVAHLHTNDDDRPKDSVLEVSILTNRDQVLLKGAAPNEAYEQNTDHDIALTVPAGLQKAQLAKTFVLVHFQPKGRDALKYNLRLELSFSDNSKVTASWEKLLLDQDHTDFAGAIYLP